MAPTFFADDDQFYTCTKALFSRLEQEDPGAADGILNARMVIRIRCAEPDVEFTVNGRQRPVHTTFGPSTLRPTLEIELAADALHQIMLGELSLRTALANGLLEVRGQVWKVWLWPIFFTVCSRCILRCCAIRGCPRVSARPAYGGPIVY